MFSLRSVDPGRPGRSGCYVYWRGCHTRSDSFTDFHSLKKIEYKSSFIGNDYQIVGYLGKEVYNTTAYSLIYDFSMLLRVESCIMTGNGHIELLKVTNYNFQPSRAR